MCTIQSHEELRQDRERYEAETVLLGWQEDEDGTDFELRNHRPCGSTLSDGTRRPHAALRVAA